MLHLLARCPILFPQLLQTLQSPLSASACFIFLRVARYSSRNFSKRSSRRSAPLHASSSCALPDTLPATSPNAPVAAQRLCMLHLLARCPILFPQLLQTLQS